MRDAAAHRSIEGVTHLLLTFLAYDLVIAVVLACALMCLVVVQGTVRAVVGLLTAARAHSESVLPAR